MGIHYSSEKNVQILITLMKSHCVKKIIVSPGAENIALVASVQQDDFFELYSAADERSAAYMACGLSAETGEPIALSCTAATASRNYVPGLTEAFYRKLPILAITSSQPSSRIGHHIPQVTDRRSPLPDTVKKSVELPVIHSAEQEWECIVKTNDALLELTRNGGGPVHINLVSRMVSDFSVEKLPTVRVIHRVTYGETFPEIKKGRIAIYVGSHKKWSQALLNAVDRFCENHGAVVLCDHTSNYTGKYGVAAALVCRQTQYHPECCKPELMIHLGEVSGAYMQSLSPTEVWRVNPDGELRDTFRALTFIFAIDELSFFSYYADVAQHSLPMTYFKQWEEEYEHILGKMPELPFSNAWVSRLTLPRIPEGSVIHFGILNSLRFWNYFRAPQGVLCYCNTGGFGIDGCVSSLIGASLANSDKLYFGVVGDLAFFYDMNSIGNRHVGSNVRLMIINNGIGAQFKVPGNLAYRSGLGELANPYIAAEGHYGNQSRQIVKHYAEDLGFEYFAANNKDEFLQQVSRFVLPEKLDRPIIFEVFTDDDDERDAALTIENLQVSFQGKAEKIAKDIIGTKGIRIVKDLIGM